MDADTQLDISRLLEAPRALVYRAFTDPEHLLAWWGPIGNLLPREDMDFDVRPGGYQRWTEIFPAQPDLRVRVEFALTAVKEGELLEGVMRVDRDVHGRVASFTSRIRLEFHEDGAARTRLEIHQWLPGHVAGPAHNGWGEALSKLETVLDACQMTSNPHLKGLSA
jgi:uncharacterized protein YndB with AHSA1/START domain